MIPDKFSVSAMFRWNNQTDRELHEFYETLASENVRFSVCDSETSQRIATTQPDLLKRMVRIADEYKIRIRDAHATWGSCIGTDMGDGNDLNELCTEARILKHETILHRLGESGVKTYVMHPGSWCSYDRTWFGYEEHYRTVAAKALERLLKTAEEERIIIGVENIFEPSSNAFEVRNLVQKFRSPWLGLCLDCGHANLMEPHPGRKDTDLVNYIQDAWKPVGAINYISGIPEMMCPDIITVHLHDNNALNDEHKNIDGTGTVDWERYAAVLAKAPRLISLQSEVSSTARKDDLIQTARSMRNLSELIVEKA